MNNTTQHTCYNNCSPNQVITINEAINDISLLQFYNNDSLYCNDCIQFSYSIDNVTWSCWLNYNDTQKLLVDVNTDFFIKVKIAGPVTDVKYNNSDLSFSVALAKCFDFNSSIISNPNLYNPYANMEYAVGLYQQLSNTVSDVVGIPAYYFKLSPDYDTKDITFKEYTLMNIDDVKQIKIIVKDNIMPSSKPEFSEWGFDFSTDWDVEISKTVFATAFGINEQPMEGDFIYIPMMKRMWTVNGAYEEKNEGLMWQATTFTVSLVKYQEKDSVDLGETQEFVDSLIMNKYEELFGDDENNMSGQETTSSPDRPSIPLYPVFESDAVRKYVSMTTEDFTNINSKLIRKSIYNKGVVIGDQMYDFINVQQDVECKIIYQKQFCGDEATVSFIIEPMVNKTGCQGTLLTIGSIRINIDMTETKTHICLFNNLCPIELDNDNIYLVYIRWNKLLNIIECNAIKQTYPPNIPKYRLQNIHYSFNINNENEIIKNIDSFNIEFEQPTKGDVTLYSFIGNITDIKVYNKYITNVSELLQMYPTNQSLLINDTCRNFVGLPGIMLR